MQNVCIVSLKCEDCEEILPKAEKSPPQQPASVRRQKGELLPQGRLPAPPLLFLLPKPIFGTLPQPLDIAAVHPDHQRRHGYGSCRGHHHRLDVVAKVQIQHEPDRRSARGLYGRASDRRRPLCARRLYLPAFFLLYIILLLLAY